MLRQFLSTDDAHRASHVLRKLARHSVESWALTGGLAIELHRLIHGHEPSLRPLNDIDFVVDSFDDIPETLNRDFLFRHVHAADPPGRTLLQFVDSETAVRIDVFRAVGATMSRTHTLDWTAGLGRIISPEDLWARSARLTLDLAEGAPMPAKHARDFLHLAGIAEPSAVQRAWQEHRKRQQPGTFEDARQLANTLIPSSTCLLIDPVYSTDTNAVCPRCESTTQFPLADPNVILSLLGYC